MQISLHTQYSLYFINLFIRFYKLFVTDAGVIASYADGTVLLVGSNEADKDAVKVAKERLDKVNANILGAVLNKFESDGSSYGYYSYYYGQDDEGSRKNKRKK